MPTKPVIDKPRMWVSKEVSTRMEGNFNMQHFQLSSMMRTTEADYVFLPIAGIREMISFFDKTPYQFLQVFIASYDAGSDVADSNKNKLTLLFGISQNLFTDAPFPLYAIYPDGTFGQDPNSKRWVDEYQNRKLPLLSTSLVRDPGENHCNTTNSMTNTRRISYEKVLISDLLKAINAIDPGVKPISGLQATFSSYTFRGKPDDNTCKLINRIFIIFEFIALDDNKVFYLEDIVDFKEKLPTNNEDSDTSPFRGVDNGHLCPPGC